MEHRRHECIIPESPAARAVARHARAGRTALLAPDASVSYAELGARIDGHARSFRQIARGDLVGVPASRSADAVARFFGVMQAGACPCFVEPGLTAEALLARAHAVGLRRIVLDDESEAMARDLEHGGLQVNLARDLLHQSRRSGSAGIIPEPLGRTDLAMMQLTSGSTGQPKGVLLTHGNLLRHAAGIIERTRLTAADRLLHVMPLHHTNGVNNQLIAPLLAGATVVLDERFRAEDVEDRIAAHGITCLTGVPTMYSRMLPHLRDQARLRSLRFLRCGSAPITVRLHEEVEAAFGVPLVVSYGLSEATCTSTMNPVDARRVGTVGRPGRDAGGVRRASRRRAGGRRGADRRGPRQAVPGPRAGGGPLPGIAACQRGGQGGPQGAASPLHAARYRTEATVLLINDVNASVRPSVRARMTPSWSTSA